MKTFALETLRTFRAGVYAALGRERNELCDLLDAIVSSGPVASLAHLSLAAPHRGGYGRLYHALAHAPASLDVAALRALVAAQPLSDGDAAGIFAVDASPWPRPDAATSAERSFCHHAARHSHGQPVVPGWNYQWLAEVSLSRDSWTAPLEVVRVPPPPRGNANTVAVSQVQRLLRRRCRQRLALATSPLVVFDAGYDAVQLGVGLAGEVAAGHVALLVRVRSNRCFYADPDLATAKATGRPRVHGTRFACADPRTWWAPTQDVTTPTPDPQYGLVRVRAWAGVHGIPREHSGRVRRVPSGDGPDRRGKVPLVRGTLLLVEVERLPRQTHAPKPLWLFWQGGRGPGQPDLARLWQAYIRRFALEHTFRFCKQTLNWVLPRLRTPAQADTWSWLVLLAYTQLRLARPLVGDHRLPWQRPLPPERLTPGRVRQGLALRAIWAQVGTPASAPQPRGRSPGRPRGRRSRRAPRFSVVKAPP